MVPAEPAHRHRERERRESRPGQRRGRPEIVVEIDGAPVAHRALGHERAERQAAEPEEPPRRPREGGPAPT